MPDQPSNDAALADQLPEPRISVIGVGGAGGNAINNMIRADLEGVNFVVANTDSQALEQSSCKIQIQLGTSITKGLGAGANPEIGQAAAEEAIDAIVGALKDSNMAFITAGMGGGTGTGAAPIIARAAREEGVLTVGVVTKPFHFEGAHRMRQAEAGIAELSQHVDTLIVIPNQNLFLVTDEKTTFAEAFKTADEVLHSGVRGVTDLIVLPGLINLDFADVHATMAGMGKAVMGTGEAEGDNRAHAAAEAAISNPLLDGISMKGARSVLINITGGMDLTLMEVDQAANRIREEVDPDANIIFGSAFSEELTGKLRVSVIATGDDFEQKERSTPTSDRPFVGQSTELPEKKSAVQVSADVSLEPAAPSEEAAPINERKTAIESAHGSNDGAAQSSDEAGTEDPLTLRLISNLPANDEDQETSPHESRGLEQESEIPDPDSASDTSIKDSVASLTSTAENTTIDEEPAQDVERLTDAEAARGSPDAPVEYSDKPSREEALTLHLHGSLPVTLDLDQKVGSGEDLSNLVNPSEPAADSLPKGADTKHLKPASRRRSLPTPKSVHKPEFSRPAKPAKTQSTLEVFEKKRTEENAGETANEKIHYIVWETGLGAQIYKVPDGKVRSVRKEPHAGRFKLFDNIESAKAEANTILERVAAKRKAKGLSMSILKLTQDDIKHLNEKNVPSYFL